MYNPNSPYYPQPATMYNNNPGIPFTQPNMVYAPLGSASTPMAYGGPMMQPPIQYEMPLMNPSGSAAMFGQQTHNVDPNMYKPQSSISHMFPTIGAPVVVPSMAAERKKTITSNQTDQTDGIKTTSNTAAGEKNQKMQYQRCTNPDKIRSMQHTRTKLIEKQNLAAADRTNNADSFALGNRNRYDNGPVLGNWTRNMAPKDPSPSTLTTRTRDLFNNDFTK